MLIIQNNWPDFYIQLQKYIKKKEFNFIKSL